MSRPVGRWDLALRVDTSDAGEASSAIFVRIARAIADDIQRGRLPAGRRLPGSRTLASALGVHRNTVIAAYRELLAEGYLVTTAGQSTRVADALPELPPRRLAPRNKSTRATRTARFVWPPSTLPAPAYEPVPNGVLALYGGLPDLRLLPNAAFGRAYRRVLRRPGVLAYGDPRGHPRLRGALAMMLRESRGLVLGDDQLVVTRGSQMALALCARALFAAGDAVAVEAYGYRPAWEALRAAGVRLLPVAVDSEGLRIDALRALCEREPLRGLYLTPHHQYPTTAILSAPRRLALLELAGRIGFAILEDDYDHEFHYEGRPILPLASSDRAGLVVYIGTLSKVLAPGVRIGYVSGPAELLRRVTADRFYLDRQGDQVTECAVAELLEEGEVQRHVRRARRVYRARRDHFVELLDKSFGEQLRFRVPSGGMALWAHLDHSLEPRTWLEHARAEGVLFQPGQLFDFHARSIPYVRLGFAGLSEPELRLAVRRLERASKRSRAGVG